MLAPTVLDRRAVARGIIFDKSTIVRWEYDEKGDIVLHEGAYHPIVWSGRDYYIGPATAERG